jgi:hypothetical protein
LLVSGHRNEELPIFDIIIPPRLLDDPGQAAGGGAFGADASKDSHMRLVPLLIPVACALAFPPVATVAGQSTSPCVLVQPSPRPTEARDKARDQYRRPVESLTFWGLKPGQTVLYQPEVDIMPRSSRPILPRPAAPISLV